MNSRCCPPRSGLEDESFEYFDVKWMATPAGFSYFGCFVSKDIPKNTLIHKERYTLQGQQIWTALEHYQSGEHSTKDDDDDYLRSIGVSDGQRQQLWRLHDQRNPLGAPRLMGIIYSNGFSNADLGREPCLFVGATSRFNHSCRPTVGMDFAGYEIRLFTSRHVSKGEELCLSYNEVIYYHSTTVRKAVLRHKFKFDCYCLACASLDPTVSDMQRRRLGILARQLATQVPGAHFLYDPVFEESINQIQREEESAMGQVELYKVDSLDKQSEQSDSALERLLEYMILLEQEGIDHDLLHCSELAFDLSSMELTSHPMKTLDIPCDPHYWGRKTLALYRLHKGEHHTSTKSFLEKLASRGIHYDCLESQVRCSDIATS